MAQVEKREKTHQISSTSSRINYPRDLLQSFTTINHNNHNYDDDDDEEEEGIELSLDLSMNGRFGIDPTAKKIKRTTSIPEFMNPMRIRDDDVVEMNNNGSSNLIRTCSLPTENEEEWKRRKELQTLRRMEARRKRYEKQRNLKAMKERNRGGGGGGSCEEMIGLEEGGGGGGGGADEFNSLRRTTSLTAKVGRLGLNGLPPPSPSPPPVSIGSSQGTTGSSVISDSESQQGLGTKAADARSSIGHNSSPDDDQKTLGNQSSPENRTKDIVRNLLEDMPCVSTKGDGPDGKKIDGFLYRYGKGEEVRIVCVCHGSFLTPAEFIKHAGGGEVANPLKHIVVSPSML
ncbi:hypothetical protein Lal_00036786 [Lupinus albus]|uniref:Ninja-family protein n=1 Tax=Lupinus albus TaxID=3870 RepID=A0A6A5NLN5_LUPAL|nr:putative ethylene-responsive binding factor-associated repression, Ninja family [Lupinus albus]KAF1888744.1 hypothetical protein Lal_00036786 [Lupinus albus]